MCVCKGCFIHIDKCPVCRSQFNTYVMLQDTNNDPPIPLTSQNEEGEVGVEYSR